MLAPALCRWDRPPAAKTLQQVAAATEGYAGADLQGLCTAAVLAAVRRQAPLLTQDLVAALADQAADEQQQAAAAARQVSQPPAEQGRTGSGELQAAAATTLDRQAAAGPACEEQQGLLLAARQTLPPDEQLQEHGMEAPQPREVAVGLHEQLQQQDTVPAELEAAQGASGAMRLNAQPQEPVQVTPAGKGTQQQEAAHAAAAPAASSFGVTAPPGSSRVRPAARPVLQRLGLQAVSVKVEDWRRALQEAPPPCCRREGTGFLRQTPACPLPWHLAPVLLPHLAALLQSCGHSAVAAQYPLLGAAAAAAAAASWQPVGVQDGARGAQNSGSPAAAAASSPQDLQQLEHALQGLGLVQRSPSTGGASWSVLFGKSGWLHLWQQHFVGNCRLPACSWQCCSIRVPHAQCSSSSEASYNAWPASGSTCLENAACHWLHGLLLRSSIKHGTLHSRQTLVVVCALQLQLSRGRCSCLLAGAQQNDT